MALVDELPEESQFKRFMGSGWTTAELILARLSNDFRGANTPEGKEIKDPLIPPNFAENDEPEDHGPQMTADQMERMVFGDMSVYDELELVA